MYQLQTEMETARAKCQLMEESIEQVTGQYGREVAALKSRLAEQNAQLVLGISSIGDAGKSPMAGRLGVPKKVKSLEPLVGSKSGATTPAKHSFHI